VREEMIRYSETHHLFSPGDKIIVGVSGGADSVCLLYLLNSLRKEMNLSLFVLHVKHGIRGDDADRDAQFVRELSDKWELPCFEVFEDVPAYAKKWGMSEEEAGRACRYEQFEKLRREKNADCIAVAHHKEDQAETFLFRLIRGSSARGLAAMLPKRDFIIRPLLFAEKGDILAFLEEKKIPWREDITNQDTAYQRNWIRKGLLPLLKENLNPGAVRHIADAADDIGKWRKYIREQAECEAEHVIFHEGKEVLLRRDVCRGLPEVLQKEILSLFLEQGISGVKDVTRAHYEALYEKIAEKGNGTFSLPGGYFVVCDYEYFRLTKNKQKKQENVCVECDMASGNIVEMDGVYYRFRFEVVAREKLDSEIPQKDYTKWFDYDKINSKLTIRNPRPGDFFVLDDKGHKKKLSRYYMDEKIAKERRDRQLVLADGAHVIWAIPNRISAACKINQNTKYVLVVTKERIRHERRNQRLD